MEVIMKKWALYGVFFFFAMSSFSVMAQEEEYTNERMDMFYEDIHAPKKRPIPLVSVRKADVVWETVIWRTINLKERFNQFFYYPLDVVEDAQGRTNLVNAIWSGIKEGRITVYADDEFKVVKDFASLESTFNKSDTIERDRYDDDDNYIGIETVVTTQNFEDITKNFYKINLKERWFIDKARTVQDVRIIGLSFVMDVYDEDALTGEKIYKGFHSLGWIRMEDPAVRELLAQTQAYNEYNDAAWLNYDQIFLTRYFESTITRESNRQNRAIERYATGLDALMEAERIKEEIFNKELDLWEY